MPWLPLRSVVVPVDFSEQSFAALDRALEFVDATHKVHMVHVLPAIDPAEPGVIWNTVDDESRSRHAEQALLQRLSDAKHEGVDIAVRFGEPGHEIADYAAGIEADMIIMPSHGRTGIKRWLIGSVAERVVRLAHCPVLVLRD